MLTNKFQDIALSRLGFGAMRLPLNDDKTIDEAQVFEMTDYALENGINYFDTAYPYHGGQSEKIIGAALARHPRDSFYLATKYPGHQIAPTYDPADIFEKQLVKCGVDYFDFYLLHNVCEDSVGVYEDPQWGIIDYFLEQKRLGRIRHLGFSSHAMPELLEAFLTRHEGEMEFCQIQMNYLDWTLQNAQRKYEILTERGIPVWVMEPLRGGKLANSKASDAAELKKLRPEDSVASWAFRWLQGLENVKMVLSGMSSLDQMKDNVNTYLEAKPLSGSEVSSLMEMAEILKDSVPCTGCRYCCDGCPMELNIPLLISGYNEVHYEPNSFTVPMMLDTMPSEKWPTACIACGACAHACPQKIDVPKVMSDFSALLPTLPNWGKVCAERAAAAAKG